MGDYEIFEDMPYIDKGKSALIRKAHTRGKAVLRRYDTVRRLAQSLRYAVTARGQYGKRNIRRLHAPHIFNPEAYVGAVTSLAAHFNVSQPLAYAVGAAARAYYGKAARLKRQDVGFFAVIEADVCIVYGVYALRAAEVKLFLRSVGI